MDSNGNANFGENETLTVDDSMVGTDPVTFICQASNQVENDNYTVEKTLTFFAGQSVKTNISRRKIRFVNK